ncbi:peroxidase family protein [Longispora albida]|uniref:peroxidase family protein n=1 Tax=Longispora albida TaxID=203523 RepID=UPI001B7F82CE|nr:peroxidase family protein [Longispora albida]
MARSAIHKLVMRLDARAGWHRLPTPLAILCLKAFRDALREHNLHDTFGAGGERPRQPTAELPPYRTYDGGDYDPDDADMGRAGTRFDRNAPLADCHPDPARLMYPSPRLVSERLLRRDVFRPATTLNALAAAWIQFQNHDWFSHGDNHLDEPYDVPLEDDDPWPHRPMTIRRTRPDPLAHTGGGTPPTYENTVTHWWDGSQLYGSTERRCRQLRTGEDGKLRVEPDGRLPEEPRPALKGIDLAGFTDNYWIGLSLLHTLFAREHNAICDLLRRRYPGWGDERLFHTARLVNAALMAKIHTIEWTPGILAHPALRTGMEANWYGLLGPAIRRRFGRIGRGEVLSGILGTGTEHHTAPYSITEEFVTCYRLHPLIPDDWEIRSYRTDEVIGRHEFLELQGSGTRPAGDQYGMANLLYTFGVSHPGAITLHNHPESLRNLVRLNGERLDLATVDVLRDRERGVPRYNGFRRMLRKPPVTSFEDLTPDERWRKELAEVYDGDIDRVDAMVGMYAEPLPRGFGFSDTAFRVFLLMASRRLKSDRFFTVDYRPEVYTPEGLRWVEDNTMTTVLTRHYPELSPALDGVPNAFSPWRRTAGRFPWFGRVG